MSGSPIQMTLAGGRRMKAKRNDAVQFAEQINLVKGCASFDSNHSYHIYLDSRVLGFTARPFTGLANFAPAVAYQ